ncbi:hypothetical protein [Neorhizobium sp. NCHU2750]|uniref:hypothetical protein n=1 Tax=Neorhizobium sp. NCHU2750 TaxID=1825976 RepID=UPI000E73980D
MDGLELFPGFLFLAVELEVSMRVEDEPGIQNHTEPLPQQRQKAVFGRSVLIVIAILATMAACVWIGIAVYATSASA